MKKKKMSRKESNAKRPVRQPIPQREQDDTEHSEVMARGRKEADPQPADFSDARAKRPVSPRYYADKAAALAVMALDRFNTSERLAAQGDGHLPARLISYQECRELSRLSTAFANAAMALLATEEKEK